MIRNSSRYLVGNIYFDSLSNRYAINTYAKKDVIYYRHLTYKICEGDSLESIAYKFYGNARKWWVIADINGIFDPDILTVGYILTIPSPISVGSF